MGWYLPFIGWRPYLLEILDQQPPRSYIYTQSFTQKKKILERRILEIELIWVFHER